jgi:hypothetical protein
MTFICCETHAQSISTPNASDTPDKNEKFWTPERMKRAKPLMPSPQTDPRKKSQSAPPSNVGSSERDQGAPPAAERHTIPTR